VTSFADEGRKQARRRLQVWLARHRPELSQTDRDELVEAALREAHKTRRRAPGTLGGWAIGRLKLALARFDRQPQPDEGEPQKVP